VTSTASISEFLRLYGRIFEESGTSMAAPAVAGVVTMLRAYNPRYGYADVVEALAAVGRDVASLFQKTVTGKAVDAIGAIGHIQAPTGLGAAVQQGR
jgi:subtilisin family serine protease